jgi:hypothetical protein
MPTQQKQENRDLRAILAANLRIASGEQQENGIVVFGGRMSANIVFVEREHRRFFRLFN